MFVGEIGPLTERYIKITPFIKRCEHKDKNRHIALGMIFQRYDDGARQNVFVVGREHTKRKYILIENCEHKSDQKFSFKRKRKDGNQKYPQETMRTRTHIIPELPHQ